MTLKEFQKKFGTRNKCLKALLELRINPERCCFNEKCRASIDDNYVIMKKRHAFLCRKCLKHVYPQSNSVFDHSHVAIETWFEIIYRFLIDRRGISANQIHNEFGYSYPTAFRMLHIIRDMMQKALDFTFDGTICEIDESYVKTGTKGLTRHHAFTRGRGSDRSSSFLTIIERGSGGRAKMIIIPSTGADSIIPKITDNVGEDTIIYTDSWSAYSTLKELGYEHAVVNHSLEFVNYESQASTNSAENIHSNFKRMVVGTYRSISHAYSQNYANEQCFRHCYRNDYDYGFEALLKLNLQPLSDTYKQIRRAA